MITATDILQARVLVVDDQQANVLLLEGMLRVAGYTAVQSTMNPREVCNLHRNNRYDLILLDLQMPGMDGFQVMEGLREIEAGGYLPVIVITAQPQHKLQALKMGAKDFVSKPFDMAELGARVNNILEVRLLHLESINYGRQLEKTIQELEASQEVVRLKTLEERKASQRDLALAQETQQGLLPRIVPEFENYRVHAFNNPTRYVGGNFYDFLQLKAGEWMGVLADVSGKGVSAALLSSMVIGALGAELRAGTQPPEALNRVNRILCEKSLPFQFVTLFLFVLNPEGQGQFISAGQPAYLFRSATEKIETLVSDSYMLGVFEFASYEPRAFQLDKGDVLVVYSDGLRDAENPRQAMFGEEGLMEIMRREGPSGSRAVEKSIRNAIQDGPQADDITFVVVEKLSVSSGP